METETKKRSRKNAGKSLTEEEKNYEEEMVTIRISRSQALKLINLIEKIQETL